MDLGTKKELALIFALLFIIFCVAKTWIDLYRFISSTIRDQISSLEDGSYINTNDSFLNVVVYTTIEPVSNDGRSTKCKYILFLNTRDNIEERYMLVPIHDGTYYTKDGIYLIKPDKKGKLEVLFNTNDINTLKFKFEGIYKEMKSDGKVR